MSSSQEALAERAAAYNWYHRIDLGGGTWTEPTPDVMAAISGIWTFIREHLAAQDLAGARVLDVGCRDCMWSLEAEQRGAARVVAIDSIVSRGARELVLPHMGSKIEMHALNVNDLTPKTFGTFDVVLFFGVLYHLRYPFWALQRVVDVLEMGGRLLIESGMLASPDLQAEPLLYCPTHDSPYDFTSCTFFNREGLTRTLQSMGLELEHAASMVGSQTVPGPRGGQVERQFLAFRKQREGPPLEAIKNYWRETDVDDGTHDALCRYGREES